MKIRLLLSFAFILILSTLTLADQAVHLTKSQAKKAIALLPKDSVILHFCEPCKNKMPINDIVEKVEMIRTKGKTWIIKINGKQIDLAYVFIEESGEYKNLARKLKIKVRNVSTSLPMDKAN